MTGKATRTGSRLLMAVLLSLQLAAVSMAQVSEDTSVNIPPPDLPAYDQPPIPAEGYIWTPGYWAWSDDVGDYYWVPGTWILAPQPEYLWTPGFWGFANGLFLWHAGYWGPQVGFYGGVNYGYGYGAGGYEGAYWRGGHLFYNRTVTNVGTVNITNLYDKAIINNSTVTRVSYNGGNGTSAQPTAAQAAAARSRHLALTPAQRQHIEMARVNPALRARQNQGRPPTAATSRPGAFSGAGVVSAKPRGTEGVADQAPTPWPGTQRSMAPSNSINGAPSNSINRREERSAPRESAQPPTENHPSHATEQRVESPPRSAPEVRQPTIQPTTQATHPAAPPPRPAAPHPAAREPEHGDRP